MMLFVSALIAIMVGSLSSMREIVKETIYRRERMVRLSLTFCLRSSSAYWCLCIKLLFSYKELAVDIPGGLEVAIGFT